MTAQIAPTGGGISSRGPAGQNSQGNSAGMKEKVPKGYRKATLQNFTPEQMELLQSLFPHLDSESFLSKIASGDQSAFEEMEAPAIRQFDQLQSQMASRFSGMGMGARRGSGFQNAGSQAASDFAQDLHSKRAEMRNQAIKDLMGYSSTLLDKEPYTNKLVKKDQKQGFDWGGLGGAAIGGAAGFFGAGGNPMTALSGAKTGYDIGSGMF